MTDPVYRVRLHFSASSTTDVTDQVLEASWSRAIATTTRNLEAGTADVLLANDQASFSPLRLAPGLMRPNIGLTIEAAVASGEAFGTLFTGFADRISDNPALGGPRNVVISCRDRMKDLARRRVDTAIQTEINVGSLVALVLDTAAITQQSIDVIAETIPFAWFKDRVVTGAIEEIIQAGGYAAYVSGDGTFRFRDRFFDLGGTVVSSYSEFHALTFDLDDQDIVNRVRVAGEPRTIVDSVQVVGALTKAITVQSSASVGFFLAYEDPRNGEAAPAVGVVTPVASQDWQLNTQADGSGTVFTATASLYFTAFAETCVATVVNHSGSTAYLTLFNVRGRPVQRDQEVAVIGELIESQSLYGQKDGTLETRLLGTSDRLATRAADILDLFGVPTPKISMSLVNQWPDVLTNELADIIQIENEHSGIDGQFTIQSVEHQLNAADRGWVHQVTYALESSKAIDEFILDSDDFGILDQNRLARST